MSCTLCYSGSDSPILRGRDSAQCTRHGAAAIRHALNQFQLWLFRSKSERVRQRKRPQKNAGFRCWIHPYDISGALECADRAMSRLNYKLRVSRGGCLRQAGIASIKNHFEITSEAITSYVEPRRQATCQRWRAAPTSSATGARRHACLRDSAATGRPGPAGQ